MGAARRDPRRGEIPVGRFATGRLMTSQYVRGVKDKWHIARKQIGFVFRRIRGRSFGLPCFRLTYIGGQIMRKAIRRGDLFYADLNPVVGSEQGGIRPVLVVQNNVGNHFSPTIVAAAITSRKAKSSLPTHIPLEDVPGLAPTSLMLLEQLRTIDRKRLRGYIGRISEEKMLEVDAALAVSIGIGFPNERLTIKSQA